MRILLIIAKLRNNCPRVTRGGQSSRKRREGREKGGIIIKRKIYK